MGLEIPSELDDVVAGGQMLGVRREQEDYWRTIGFGDNDPNGCDLLMVVADGMGGHRGGAQASRLAVVGFVDAFRKERGSIRLRLRAGLDGANASVRDYVDAHEVYRGMGCTLVACAVTDQGSARWISVGDSPLWVVRWRSGRMERLNADHSMRPVLEDWVQLGHITKAEVEGEAAGRLRSAVTGGELSLVDDGGNGIYLGVGDEIVLGSDGLATLSEGELVRRCREKGGAAEVVASLLGAVMAKGVPSQDNATVVVYRHGETGGVGRRLKALAGGK